MSRLEIGIESFTDVLRYGKLGVNILNSKCNLIVKDKMNFVN